MLTPSHSRDRLFTKTVKIKTGRTITKTVGQPATEADVRAEYERLLREEIEKRKLFSVSDIVQELRDLTRWWDPFDPAANPKYAFQRKTSIFR